MLLHAMWVKAVNPENRVIDPIANAISPVVLGELHDPAEAERAQSRIVKGGGTADVRDSNPGVVDHCASSVSQRLAVERQRSCERSKYSKNTVILLPDLSSDDKIEGLTRRPILRPDPRPVLCYP